MPDGLQSTGAGRPSRGLIREELRDIQCKSEQTKQAGDVDDSVLGFLRALQEGDDMT